MPLMRNIRRRVQAVSPTAPPEARVPQGRAQAPSRPVQRDLPETAPVQPPASVEARRAQRRAVRAATPDALTPGPIIAPVLNRVDREPEPVREQASEHLHVSGLLHGCPRMLQLARRSGVPLYQSTPTGGHRVMWEIGRAVERHIRNQYIKGVEGRNVRGTWKCNCGRLSVDADDRPDRERQCEMCRSPAWVYHERRVFDGEWNVGGSPDMVVIERGMDAVIEIKSMNPTDFETLSAPVGAHVEQAALYRRLLQRAGRTVAPYVVIVYCNKEFVYGSPYKEFAVLVDENTHWHEATEHMIATASRVMETQLIARLPQCTSVNKPKPRSCPTCVDCFSRAT